jgi:hypothetical protein
MEAVIACLAPHLPTDDITEASMYVEAGEFGVAFEYLCNQLIEWDTSLPQTTLSRLYALGEKMKIDPTLWRNLPGA